MKIKLHQTLKNKDNVDYVENHGPFKCVEKHAWLGFGYYFWDTHIELAHWWGNEVHHSREYLICEAYGIIDSKCWDLHGNGEHREELKALSDEMVARKVVSSDKVLVPNIIEFFKNKGKFFYTSIRALGTYSISDNFVNKQFILRYPFMSNGRQCLDMFPPVQICLIEKKALSLNSYSVIYPEHYRESYT
ncbi:MAG: hypothetical protein M3Q58_06815 [Bacteroidota bacterium]|nr:hypothetical protein [Bacteroidota bacterium]